MNNQSPFKTTSQKKKRVRQPQNFAEALKSIGGHTAKPFKHNQNIEYPTNFESQATPEWLPNQEQQNQKEAHRARHRELISTPVYDRRQEEVKAQIKTLRDELKALAKEIANLGSSVHKAIEEEISEPGSYHINFFEKLKSFIVLLRKSVSESKNWFAISSKRNSSRSRYWGNFKKSGTKYMLSSERTLATQSG